MSRVFYTILGWIAVGLGVIGIPVPGLPTTPFMILAAFFFAKGSPRARAWLVGHPTFGAHIVNWESEGSISPRAKKLSLGVMGLVFLASFVFGAPWIVIFIQGSAMIPAAWFVWSRPDPSA